jgi:hypothetical protein
MFRQYFAIVSEEHNATERSQEQHRRRIETDYPGGYRGPVFWPRQTQAYQGLTADRRVKVLDRTPFVCEEEVAVLRSKVIGGAVYLQAVSQPIQRLQPDTKTSSLVRVGCFGSQERQRHWQDITDVYSNAVMSEEQPTMSFPHLKPDRER